VIPEAQAHTTEMQHLNGCWSKTRFLEDSRELSSEVVYVVTELHDRDDLLNLNQPD
jgi:hypothetical protein